MNYYDILGVDKHADDARIKRAFRMRAKQLHPDVNRAERAKKDFQLVNEAYQVLSDVNKRSVYDMRLARGTHGQRVYYRPGSAAAQRSYAYTAYRNQAYRYQQSASTRKPAWAERVLDQVLFLFMLLAGLTALFYGLYKAFVAPDEEFNPYLAITFGVFFTVLFLVGWHVKQKDRD